LSNRPDFFVLYPIHFINEDDNWRVNCRKLIHKPRFKPSKALIAFYRVPDESASALIVRGRSAKDFEKKWTVWDSAWLVCACQ
jgi:hypothetical protein